LEGEFCGPVDAGGGCCFSTACLCFSDSDGPVVARSTGRTARYVVHNKIAARMKTAITTAVANAGFDTNGHRGSHCFHRDDVTVLSPVITTAGCCLNESRFL